MPAPPVKRRQPREVKVEMSAKDIDSVSMQSIPLVEEAISIDRRAVETGRVRIQTGVEERVEFVRQDLAHQQVEIEERKLDRVLETMPAPRQEGDVLIIPIVEERIVVTKELVLVKELHVRRTTHSETVEEPVSLRNTKVTVERIKDHDAAIGTELLLIGARRSPRRKRLTACRIHGSADPSGGPRVRRSASPCVGSIRRRPQVARKGERTQ